MNLVQLHGLWTTPLSSIAKAAASVATTEYRPVGGLVYRILHWLFGMEELPYRTVSFALCTANLLLTYRAVSRVSDRKTALFSVAIAAYHGAFLDLYFNFGTIYDLLAYTFTVLTILEYTGRHSDKVKIPIVSLLHGLALGSKEIAAPLPAILYLYDLLVVGGNANRPRWRPSVGVLATAAESAVFLGVKVFLPNDMSDNPLYAPNRSVESMISNAAYYLGMLLYLDRPLMSAELIVFIGIAGFAVAMLRDRVLAWSLAAFVVFAVPLLLIPPRAGYVLYLPFLGLSLAAGRLCALMRLHFLGKGEGNPAIWAYLLMAVLGGIHLWLGSKWLSAKRIEHNRVRSVVEGVVQGIPNPRTGDRLYFDTDPFLREDWALKFLLQLRLKDPSLLIERKVRLETTDEQESGLYDYIIAASSQSVRIWRNPNQIVGTAAGSVIAVKFDPTVGSPGARFSVFVPELGGREVDVLYRLYINEKIADTGIARRWCVLDEKGRATLMVPAGHRAGRVAIVAIREHGAVWHDAVGEFKVLP